MNEAQLKEIEEKANKLIEESLVPVEEEKPELKLVDQKIKDDGSTPPQQQKQADEDKAEIDPEVAIERMKNAEASFKHAQAKMTKATQEVSELRSKVEMITAENNLLKEKIEVLQAAPATPAVPDEPLSGDDDLQSFHEQYGHDFDPVVNRMREQDKRSEQMGSKVEKLESSLEEMEKSRAEAERKAAEAEHFAAIMKAHPDMDEIVASDDFKGWVLRQPPGLQHIVEHGSAEDAIYVLDEYKKSQQPVHSPADAEGAAAAADPSIASTPTRPSQAEVPRFTRAQLKSMTPEEYEKAKPLIDQWMAAGSPM